MLKTVRKPSSRRTGVTLFMAGWKVWANNEADAHLLDRLGDAAGIEIDLGAQRLQHVGAAAGGGHGAVAVLGHGDAAARQDEGRGGGDG